MICSRNVNAYLAVMKIVKAIFTLDKWILAAVFALILKKMEKNLFYACYFGGFTYLCRPKKSEKNI